MAMRDLPPPLFAVINALLCPSKAPRFYVVDKNE